MKLFTLQLVLWTEPLETQSIYGIQDTQENQDIQGKGVQLQTMASPTIDHDIFSSWFYEQSNWGLGAAWVLEHKRTRISRTQKKTWKIQDIEED